jgi:secretion/DNA translocation related TadE-like protein
VTSPSPRRAGGAVGPLGSSQVQAEAGVATVAVVGLGGALLAAGLAAVLVADAVVARHRAGAAADFAALAGASRALAGETAACRAARAVSAADGARLTVCVVRGSVVRVQTAVDYPGPLRRLGPARATAEAGPADRQH